jgi:hypothetical protein
MSSLLSSQHRQIATVGLIKSRTTSSSTLRVYWHFAPYHQGGHVRSVHDVAGLYQEAWRKDQGACGKQKAEREEFERSKTRVEGNLTSSGDEFRRHVREYETGMKRREKGAEGSTGACLSINVSWSKGDDLEYEV